MKESIHDGLARFLFFEYSLKYESIYITVKKGNYIGAICMKGKKILGWIIGIAIVVGLGTWGTFAVLENVNDYKAIEKKHETAAADEGDIPQDVDQEVVNTPIALDVVTLADGGDGHTFIADTHSFLNDTLGYGGVNSADYRSQRANAEDVLQALKGAKVKNKEITADFKKIEEYANVVFKEDNRDAMVQLHRLFHDLDIYFNGYDYDQTWGVTDFEGE